MEVRGRGYRSHSILYEDKFTGEDRLADLPISVFNRRSEVSVEFDGRVEWRLYCFSSIVVVVNNIMSEN